MRTVIFVLVLVLVGPAITIAQSKTYVGVVTDTMCNQDHTSMNVTPDEKCIAECIRSGSYKLGLTVGEAVYALSDQETPAKFAGKKVKIVGTLYVKTNILKVESIEAAK